MEGKDRRAFEAWVEGWIAAHPEGAAPLTAMECRLGEAALAEGLAERIDRKIIQPAVDRAFELMARDSAGVDNHVDGVDGDAEPSLCHGISDAVCASRPSCRMPDGSWCPVFTPPTWGSRW
jgi:hypothetical protein